MGGAFVDLEADPEPSSSAGANGAASSGGGSASSGGGSVQQHPAQQRQGRLYVPEFNSAVFFRVPRYHRQAGQLGYWSGLVLQDRLNVGTAAMLLDAALLGRAAAFGGSCANQACTMA